MIKKIALVALSMLCIALASCYRCHKARHYRQQPGTHKYVPSVKAGSYFVYRNVADATDQDTLYVVQNTDSMVFAYTEKQCDGNYFERQFITMVFAHDRDTVSESIYSGTSEDSYQFHSSMESIRDPIFPLTIQ